MSEFLIKWKNLLNELEKDTNFTVSERMKCATIDDIRHVLALVDKGLQCIDRSFSDEGTQITLKAKDDAMHTAINVVLSEAQQKSSELQQKYNEILLKYNHLKEKSEDKESSLRITVKHEIEEEIQRKVSERYEKIVSVHETNHKQMSEIICRLQKEVDAIPRNNTAKGKIGEQNVEAWTREALRGECETKSTAYDAHNMDINVSTTDGFACQIEVKAVENVRTDRDVNKFHRDIQELIDKGEVNAAAFVSLDGHIPNIPSGTLLFRTNAVGLNIPVFYVHVTNKEVLLHTIKMLKEIQKLCLLEHSARGSEPMPIEVQKYHEEKRIFQQILPEMFKNNFEEEEDLKSQIEHLLRCKEIAEKRLQKLKINSSAKSKLQDQIPWLFNDETTHINAQVQKMDRAMQLWERFKEEHNGKEPQKTDDFGAESILIKNIGFVRVRSAVAEKKRKEKQLIEAAKKQRIA